MEITIKLMGLLKEKTPPDSKLELADGADINAALAALDVVSETIAVFTVNGSITRDRAQVLNPGDELTVLPPVGGG